VLKDDVDYLRDFLIRFDKINISIKHPERKKWIEAWVGRIIDDVLAYSACIQNMEPGWSATEGIRLKRDHQLFLDPYREDDAFQAARKSSGWQSTVCADFARWLNKTLVGKEKQFSPQPEHTRMWIALIEEPLREYDELTQMDIKFAREKT
jgi:CRISPR-associated protein Csy1